MHSLHLPRVAARAAALLTLALLAACDGGPTETPPKQPDGIYVVTGASLSDTVDAIRPDSLNVKVISGGRAAAGYAVEFAGLPAADCVDCSVPTVWVAPGNFKTLVALTTVTTNANGEASVVVRLGTVAGAGRLRVRVSALNLDDTLTFTVAPGKPVATRILPRDSAIYLNTTAHLRAAVVDRYGNARTEPVTLAVAGGLSLSGEFVTGAAYGVGKVVATSAVAPLDSTHVMVVPHGTLAAMTSFQRNSITVFDLDGSNRHTLSFPGQVVNGLDWTPDGSNLVVSLGPPGGRWKLYTVSLAGVQTELFAGSVLFSAWRPAFSANGQWLYFVGTTAPGEGQIWRAHADGSGLERVGTGQELVKTVAPSPDGSRVAYARSTFSDPLQILTIATGQVTSFGITTEGLRWSPTAPRLSLRQIGGPATMNVDGTGFRTYTEYLGIDDPAAPWSPDGNWIAANHGVLELIQVDTGLRIPLMFTGEFSQAAWKP